MAKVKLGLDKLDYNGIVALANQIKTAMTGNANFAEPNPPLDDLAALTAAASAKMAGYQNAVAAAQVAMTERDNAIEALKGILVQEAAYVDNIAAGDAAKIESAGMSVRAERAAVVITQVLGLVVTAGDYEGTLDASWDPIRGNKGYEVQTSPDPMSLNSWTFKMWASKSSATITGLTSGSKVWVKVRALGADNQVGPWSDPAVKMVP